MDDSVLVITPRTTPLTTGSEVLGKGGRSRESTPLTAGSEVLGKGGRPRESLVRTYYLSSRASTHVS